MYTCKSYGQSFNVVVMMTNNLHTRNALFTAKTMGKAISVRAG